MTPFSSRKTAQHASSRATAWYRQLFQHLPYPALLLVQEAGNLFRIEEVNQAAERALGSSKAASNADRLSLLFGTAWQTLAEVSLATEPYQPAITDQAFLLPQHSQAVDLTATPLDTNHVLITWRIEPLSPEPVEHAPASMENASENLDAWAELRVIEQLYQQTPIKLHVLDSNGQVVAVNPNWLKVLGYTREEVIGKPIISFLTPASQSYAREQAFPSLLRDGVVRNVPYQFVRKDGSILNALLTAGATFDANRNLQHVLAVIVDAAKHKVQTKELLHQRHLLQRAEEIARVGHWEIDLTNETPFPQWSREVYRIHGRDPDSYTPNLDEAIDAYHPDDRDRVAQVVNEAIEQGKPFEFELRLVRPDGEIRHVHSRGECSVDEAGTTTSIFGVFLDITDHKRQEQRLAAEQKRLSKTLEQYELLASNMQDLVCLHDADGTYQWISPSVECLLGFTPEELIGTSPYVLFHPKDLQRIQEGSHADNLEGEDAYIQYRIRAKSGGYIWFETISRPILNDDGDVVQIQTHSREITKRMEALEALRLSEERYELAVTGSNDGLWDWDVQTDEVWYSDRMINLLGWTSDVFPYVFESWAQTLHPDEKDSVMQAVQAHLNERAPYDIEYQCRSMEGTYRWFRARGQAIWDDDGNAIRMSGSLTDIHDRKKAETLLARERERVELAILGAGLGTWDANLNTGITRYNPRWAEMLGYTLAEVDADPEFFFKHCHPDDLPKFWAGIDAFVAGEAPLLDVEIRIRHKDGSWRWILDRGKVVRKNPDGSPARVAGTHMDITERKHTEEALRIREERMHLLYQLSSLNSTSYQEQIQTALRLTTELLNLDYGILSKIDPAENTYTVVEAYAPDTSIVPGTTFKLGNTYCSLTLESNDVLAINHMGRSDYERHPCYEAFNLETYIGIPIYVDQRLFGTINFSSARIRSGPFEEADSELLHLLSHWVTAQLERQQAQRALSDYAEELKVSNEELEQFAYIASHDLQEPLRTIRSFIGLLEQKYAPQFDEQGLEFMQFITGSAERMQTLIKDILAYSRVGRKDINKQHVDLNDLFARTRESLLVTLQEQDATLTSDPLPTVIADPTQIGVLLQNLVANGIKFRGENAPAVHVSAERVDDQWRIFVRDNGIGIPERQHTRIFEVFKRLHRREAYEGTGIGLAICKKVIERHGGTIWVESAPGMGSTFCFTLRAS